MNRLRCVVVFVCSLVAALAGAQPAVEVDADLPAADEVFARYVEAVGGAAALQTKKAMTSKGSFEVVGMGVGGFLETYRAVPNLQYDRVEIEGLGVQEQGFDGEVAWESSTILGPNVLEGERLDLARLDAEFFPELHHERLYDSITTVARTDFADTPCHQILAVTAGGHERHLYFAEESGLLLGMRENRVTEMGAVDVEVRVGDYRTVDDVLVPTTMETRVLGQTQRFTIESTTFEDIDPARFELPEDVKVLLGEDS